MAEHSNHDPLASIAVDRVPPAGHYGLAGETGLSVSTREAPFIALVAARRSFTASVRERLNKAFSVTLADGPHATSEGHTTFIGTGPGRFLVLSRTDADLAGTLRAVIGTEASITDQSDAFLLFVLSGGRIAPTLAKGATMDLDPLVFRPGMAATTSLAHIGVTLWRASEETCHVLVPRSLEAAFTRFIIASAAEYGLSLDNRSDDSATGRG